MHHKIIMSLFTNIKSILFQDIANKRTAIKSNKVIFGNILSLGFLQVFKYILPLITLPYILRILGPERFGLISFAGAFVGYFTIIINYGFNLTATKDISINRDDNKKISEIFWNVIVIKAILFLLSAGVFSILIFSFDIFRKEYLVFLFSFLLLIGEVLFPVWMFQGMEKMKYITIINVIVRTIFLFPIFIFIKTIDDYALFPIITSVSFIVIGIVAFVMAIKIFKIQFVLPTISSIKYNLVKGWHVFVSSIFISLYTISTIFILRMFTNNTVVGYYSSAEKLVRAVQGFISVISQAVYPNISNKLKKSKEATISFLSSVAKMMGIVLFILGVFLLFGAPLIVDILFGSKFISSVVLIRILAFVPFVIGFNTVFLTLGMLNFGYKKEVAYIIVPIAIFSLFISIPLSIYFGGEGMAISVLVTEILIGIVSYLFLLKKGIKLFKI